MLSSFIDGQLPPGEQHDIARLLEQDGGLAARAQLWTRQSDALRDAFEGIADEPLPLPFLTRLRAATPADTRARTRRLVMMAFWAGVTCGLLIAWAMSALL